MHSTVGVMVGMLPLSVVDRRSGQTKNYEIVFCLFFAKRAAVISKNNDSLAKNQYTYISEWTHKSTDGLLFLGASSMKIQQSVLVY